MNKSGQTAYNHHFLRQQLALFRDAVSLRENLSYWLSHSLPFEDDPKPADERTGESLACPHLLLPLYSYLLGSKSTNMDHQNGTLVGSKGSDLPHRYMGSLASNNLCTELVAMVSQRQNYWKMYDGALVIEKHHMRYAFCGSSRN